MLPRSFCMRYFIPAVIVVAVDQLIKYWIRISLLPGESIHVIGDFFRIMNLSNYGAALGVLSGQRWILTAAPVVIIIIGLVYLLKHPGAHWMCKLALTLIMAGGVGNLIDRVLFGHVTDMFAFSIFPPVFNLADVSVTFGCFLLIIYVLLGDRQKKGR